MTIEEIRGDLGSEIDKFPVGMRVLAVDDDPTCLKLLDGLLRKCQYQVTTTSQARIALKMLRENKNRFDLVISDVHMPDMDGFKLLELVGLEMDLPVIMLSGNSNANLVMKGISHGACDYLVKPVRIEELKNIWQHVIRRKKFDSKHQNKSTSQDKAHQESGEDAQEPALTGNAEQNRKLNKKRKDDEEEDEDNGHENEDPSTQKKPRVVWSIELHRKFVAAVNQLGIEKAVPKRILDMMNVEGLTRENVASHLQKYRLYLKRISSVATQQANMVAALGGRDSSYMRMCSLDGLGDFRTLAGSGRITSTALTSYTPGGMLGRLNSPAGISLCSLNSSALIQPCRAQNLDNSINTLGKFQPVVSPASPNASLFQGIPSSLELDQLQQSKCTALVGDLDTIDDPRAITAVSAFTGTKFAVGSSSSMLTISPSNPLMLRGNSHQTQTGGGFRNQSSIKVASLNSESFDYGGSGSSNNLDHGRHNENWQNAIQLKFPLNSSPLSDSFNHDQLPSNSMRENPSSTGPQNLKSPIYFSSSTTVSEPLEDSRREMQCQEGMVSSVVWNVNHAKSQRWVEHKQDYTPNSSNIFSTLNSQVPANGVLATLGQSMDQNNGLCTRKMNVPLIDQSNGGASTLVPHNEIEKSNTDSRLRSNEYMREQTKSQGGFVPNSYGSLDDLLNAMIKREQDGTMLMDGEFGFAAYSFGSCI